eukprot:m.140968 g.140968  ORF g.140968 m.140968 type:complete len:691 (-) comp13190_c0_seq5:4664-6736(-)
MLLISSRMLPLRRSFLPGVETAWTRCQYEFTRRLFSATSEKIIEQKQNQKEGIMEQKEEVEVVTDDELQPPAFQLRDYQEDAIQASLKAFEEGSRRVAISLPTGSGKTVIFSNLIPRVESSTPAQNKTLVLAHRVELLNQAKAKIEHINDHLQVYVDSGKNYSSELDSMFHCEDMRRTEMVVVGSVAKLGRKNGDGLDKYDPDQFKLIVIDEAHHATADSYVRILKHFQNATHPPLIWGCTATLSRHDRIPLGKVFDVIAFTLELQTLINSNHLSRINIIQVDKYVSKKRKQMLQAENTMSTTSDDDKDLESDGILTTSSPQRDLPRHFFEKWAKFAKGRKSTLVFASNIEMVGLIREEFREQGVDARQVTGTTPVIKRAQLIDDFSNQRFPVLINVSVLTEGTDIPCVDCILIARSMKSSTVLSQVVGRGLRRFPGKEDCLVIDCGTSCSDGSLVITPTLEGEGKGVREDGATDEASEDSLVSFADLIVNNDTTSDRLLNYQYKASSVDPFAAHTDSYVGPVLNAWFFLSVDGNKKKVFPFGSKNKDVCLVLHRKGSNVVTASLFKTSSPMRLRHVGNNHGSVLVAFSFEDLIRKLHQIPAFGKLFKAHYFQTRKMEKNPPTEKQMALLRKRGFFDDEIGSMAEASKEISRGFVQPSIKRAIESGLFDDLSVGWEDVTLYKDVREIRLN